MNMRWELEKQRLKREADLRRVEVLEMRAAGMTYQQIGKVLGLTRQRVHQMANENGRKK